MVLTDDDAIRCSGPETRFALHFAPWATGLLSLIPGALENSGVQVTGEQVRVRVHPWGEVTVPRDAITRVWRTRAGDVKGIRWPPFLLNEHTIRHRIPRPSQDADNLVAIDTDPPATARVWGVSIEARRVVVSLEDPDGFIATVLW